MIRKDYILRLVEEMARFIGRILGLLKEEKYEEAEKWLQKGYDLLHADKEKLLNLPPVKVAEELEKKHGLDFIRMELIADLFATEGEILTAKRDQMAHEMYIKARALYEYIDLNHTVYSFERTDKILKMKEKSEDR